MLSPQHFFELKDEISSSLFADCEYVWESIAHVRQHVMRLVGTQQVVLGEVMPGAYIGNGPLYIAESARIEPGAFIQGPAYIGPGVVVRHGAYVRENVILLQNSLLGHASEIKNSILLPHAHAPHFNYIGDSILGQHVNLGAGTRLSNLGMLNSGGTRSTIKLVVEGQEYDTGLTKLGAILGDYAQTGCNAVLNPGCLVGRGTVVYANISLRKGFYPAHSIVKLRQQIEIAPQAEGGAP